MTHIPTQQPDSASVRSSHTLSLDRRRHAAVTGVADVLSFHETEIVLKIDTGLMILSGQGLHIAKLLLEEGRLDVDGQVDSVVYETPRKPLKAFAFWKPRKR